MPRKSAGPYLAQNKRGFYEIRWTEHGRSRRISTTTQDPAAAQAALAHFILGGGEEETKGLTIAQGWAIYWDEHVVHKVVDQTRLTYAWQALSRLGEHYISELLPVHVNDYVASRREDGVGNSTIRRELVSLTAAINYLIRTRRVAQGDTPYIPLPPSAPPRDRWLTEDEVNALVSTAMARSGELKRWDRTTRFIMVAVYTGARRRAIERLQWSRIDLERGLIDFEYGGPKTKKNRPTVPISDELLPFLKHAYEQRKGDMYLDHSGSVRKGFATVCAAAGLEDVTPHTLRHTWASHAAMRGVPLIDIARVLGNSVDMVVRVYAKWSPQHLRSAVNFRGNGASNQTHAPNNAQQGPA